MTRGMRNTNDGGEETMWRDFAERYGIEHAPGVRAAIEAMIADGYVRRDGDRLLLTLRGRLHLERLRREGSS